MKYTLVATFAALSLQATATEPPDQRTALRTAQNLIGEWRGVGQPRRGSSAGAWRETASWAWDFAGENPAIVFQAPHAKHLRRGRLVYDSTAQHHPFTWTVDASDSQTAVYHGAYDEQGALDFTLDENGASADLPDRVVLRVVASGDRLVMTLQRRIADEQFARLAEVGYTRQGGNFAPGDGIPECIVTGGRASIELTHEGQTVYVCCGGCREAFLADPAGILADYAKRKKAAKPRLPD